MKDRTITVFGGTGFLCRRIVRHLRAVGASVRIASRHPDRARAQSGNADPELEAIAADVHSGASVASAVVDAYGVINAVSLYVERGGARSHEPDRAGAHLDLGDLTIRPADHLRVYLRTLQEACRRIGRPELHRDHCEDGTLRAAATGRNGLALLAAALTPWPPGLCRARRRPHLTARLLAREMILAADPGVRARLLLDDTIASGEAPSISH